MIKGAFSEQKYERVNIDPIPEELVRLVDEVKNPDSAADMIESYRKVDDWMQQLGTMYSMAYIRYTVNTADEFYLGERDYYDRYLPAISELSASMGAAIASSPYRAEMAELIGETAIKNMELSAKAISPEIIGDLQRENELKTKYQTLTASARIDFDGKKLTLPQLVPYQEHTDRAVREASFRAQGQYFADNRDKLEGIFDELVKVRTSMARKLGFNTFTEMAYCRRVRNCYGPRDVEQFREQVARDVVPLVSELLRLQYRRTDIGDPKIWDRPFEFKNGNPTPKGSPETIFENGKKMYSELSPETGEFMSFMLEHGLFDILSKENKANGGYCTDLPKLKAPFVFANFNGTKGDIEVLTHECGHAFEGYIASRMYELSAPQEYTYDVAEIHSMSMEFFTYPWMGLFFESDADKFYFAHLSGSLMFWPYGCMVDHFQHSIYDNPDWTAQQRNEEWLRLEKIYRPDVDFGGLPSYSEGTMWQRQLHIYLEPFYYIDYCMAQYAAVSYWKLMNLDRDAAWKSYFELVKKAGTLNYIDLISQAGIASPFGQNSVNEVAVAAYEYLLSIEKTVSEHDRDSEQQQTRG